MADQFVQVPTDSSGKKIDTSELTVGANTVERQRVVIADPTNATSLVAVKAASTSPVATDPAVVVAISPNSQDQIETVGTLAALGALNNAASIVVQAEVAVGMFLAAGTLVGTIVAEASYDGGTTWVGTFFDDPSTSNKATSIVFGSSNTATSRSIIGAGGASNYRVRVSLYTSGTANCTLRGNEIYDPSTLHAGAPGAAVPPTINIIGGGVTTAAPTYVTATANTLSLTTGGGVRTDASTVAGTALGTPTNFGTTPGAVVASSVNASLFVGTTVAVSSSAGVQKVGISGNAGAAVDAAVGTMPTNNLAAIPCATTNIGAATLCSVKSAQATAVNIKASAGNLYGFAIVSATATAGFVMFFNTATTATTGAVLAVPIAASGTLIITPATMALLNFSTGIAINVANPINGTTTQITWTGSVWFF